MEEIFSGRSLGITTKSKRFSSAYGYFLFVIGRLLCGLIGTAYGSLFGFSVSIVSPLVTVSQGWYIGGMAGFVAGVTAGFIGAGPMSGAIGLVCATLIMSNSVATCVMALFFAILPFINGLFDYISLCMTRFLLGLFVKMRSKGAVYDGGILVFLVLADLGFALGCIAALVYSLHIAVVAYNSIQYVPQAAHVDWLQTVEIAYGHPFKEGLSITLMLWLTFLPSAFNLAMTTMMFFIKRWNAIGLRLKASDDGRQANEMALSLSLYGAATAIVCLPVVAVFRWVVVGTVLLNIGFGKMLFDFARQL